MFAVADFTQCQKIVTALLNAGPDDFSFSVNVGDERFGTIGAASDQVKEAIYAADEQVFAAIAETEGHWARPDLMDWSSLLDHLDEIPAHIGKTGDVQILTAVASVYVGAQPATVAEIREWRRADNNSFGALGHQTAGNALAGYSEIRDNVIHFTGYRAAVKIVGPYTRGSSVLQSPSIYQVIVWVGALALLFPKEGSWLAKGSFMVGQQLRMLNDIRGLREIAPALEQYKEEKG